MNKLAFSLVAALAVPAILSAQSATGSVNVNATVQSAVSFGTQTAADFGIVTPNVAATVTPGGTGGGLIPISFNTNFTVTAPATVSLLNGAASITVTSACAEDANGASATPTSFVCATGYNRAGVTTAGTHYLFVGGTIPAAQTATAPAGVYSGSLTFTATFVSF